MSELVAITGAHGQLGFELRRRLGNRAIGLPHADLDITDRQQVEKVIGGQQPRAIINCGAYTAVDRAEHEPDQCYQINATAVEHLAAAAERTGAKLVQISSDYVFGGDA